MRLRKPAIRLTLAACAAAAGLAAAEPAQSELTERAQVRLVRMPVLLEAESAGDCDGIAADEIEILEDGLAVSATHFEPRRLRAVHAVAIDLGAEMLDHLPLLRQVAGDYAESLPFDEPALLATFDTDLTLRAPLSTNRQELIQQLEWLETGYGSHLWDSTRLLIRFLDSRPERKVLVLLTDGCDSEPGWSAAAAQAAELALGSESLVVFPVNLRPGMKCPGSSTRLVEALKELALWSGGEYYETGGALPLRSIVETIRARVDRERYVTYRPPSFGAGPKDRADKNESRWRKRRIRFRDRRSCSISIAGSPSRYESRDGGRPQPLRRSAGLLPVPFALAESADRLHGTLELDGVRRPLTALIPPLDHVVARKAKPQNPLFQALAAVSGFRRDPGLPALDGSWESWTDVPLLIDGRALLEVRGALAEALAERPDYRHWARERIRADRLRQLDGLLAEAGGAAGVDELRAVRQLLEGEEWPLEPYELEKYLGSWLGDLSVMETFNAIETWLARQVLAAVRRDGAQAAAAAERHADESWRRVRGWFPPAAELPFVGLLIPGYDPLQDSVGFYRIALRPPRSLEINSMLQEAARGQMIHAASASDSALHSRLRSQNFSYDAPLSVRFVRWMLEQEETAARLLDGFDVAWIRYAHSSSRDLLPILKERGHDRTLGLTEVYLARQVTVTLVPRDDPTAALSLSAYFPHESGRGTTIQEDPVCLVFPADIPRSGASAGLVDALIQAERRSGAPCLLQDIRYLSD